MAYVDSTEMIRRFKDLELIELTNRDDRHATTINDDELQVAIDDASAEIDAILGSRMSVPLDPPPAVLVSVCCDMTRFHLYAGRAPEEVQNRYDNAHKLLGRMAKGDVRVGINDSSARGTPTFSKPATIFDEGLFK